MNFIKKETPAQVVFFWIFQIFGNTSFTEHFLWLLLQLSNKSYHKFLENLSIFSCDSFFPFTKFGKESRFKHLSAVIYKRPLETFPVNFAKFLRTPFLQNTFGRTLLNIRKVRKLELTGSRGFEFIKTSIAKHLCMFLILWKEFTPLDFSFTWFYL